MERESFIFYKSFYEAISDLPKDIRLEVLTAIIEYALYGRQPENLKPFARGMFTLVRPNIDANTTRYVNGSKGGRKKSKNEKSKNDYSLTFKQEVEVIRANEAFMKSVCKDFNISEKDYNALIPHFLKHCQNEGKKKGKSGHDSPQDAESHFIYWMSKAYKSLFENTNPSGNNSADYAFKGGFGGMDV